MKLSLERFDFGLSREQQQLDQFLQTDRACVEIGARLIPLVESKRTKGLADRIGSLRNELTRKHGLWVPAIRIRDNMQLEPEAYRILMGGREVARGERTIDLTKTEFELLALLMHNAGIVLTRVVIYERIWGYDFETNSTSLDVYIGYLRRKTEEAGEPRLIHTVRGVGYTAREQ